MSDRNPLRRISPAKKILIVTVIAAALALTIGGVPRLKALTTAAHQSAELSEPTVAVVSPTRAAAEQGLVLPGDVQAYQAAGIYARTSGYLAHWYTDIGTQVKSGQLLAEINSPEVDAELAQALSDAATASANAQIAKVTAMRWQQMLKSNAVSKQSSEENVSIMKAKQSTLVAALANVGRLKKLQSFEKVCAPFAGVITVRNVDTGALIDAGNGGKPAALFQLAEVDRLRVFVNVPQDQIEDVHIGTKAQLTVSQFPGRTFSGTVARTSGAIDSTTRTMRVEVDLNNADGMLRPGAFAQATLMLSSSHPGLTLPANTLLFRPTGVQVATVDSKGVIALRTVSLGRDFGARVEIRTGVSGNEQVIVNPGDAITTGQVVRINHQPSDPV